MVDIDGKIDKVLNIVDSKISSDKEREQIRTDRLNIDNTSPFKLPHLIRPIAFIWAMVLQTVLSVVSLFEYPDQLLIVLGSNTAILTSIVGFYFNSRKQEKLVAKKAAAAIQIAKEETKQERVNERRAFRLQKIKERQK